MGEGRAEDACEGGGHPTAWVLLGGGQGGSLPGCPPPSWLGALAEGGMGGSMGVPPRVPWDLGGGVCVMGWVVAVNPSPPPLQVQQLM